MFPHFYYNSLYDSLSQVNPDQSNDNIRKDLLDQVNDNISERQPDQSNNDIGNIPQDHKGHAINTE